MSAQLTKPGLSPVLLQRVAEQRTSIAQFRAEHGDPEEAFHAFMRETFAPDALVETYREYLENEHDLMEQTG